MTGGAAVDVRVAGVGVAGIDVAGTGVAGTGGDGATVTDPVVVRTATPSRFLFFSETLTLLSGLGPLPRRRQDAPAPVRWRLAGSNQRFTGVAATAAPDLAAALADTDDLREALPLLSGEVCAVAPGRWTWTLRRPDGPALVRAPRSYGRRVDCRRSLELFLAQVPTAGRDPTLRLPGQRQARPRRPGPVPEPANGPVADPTHATSDADTRGPS